MANAKISGTVGGATPRALINGRLVRSGDVVESTLGITFEGFDPEKNQITFKDKSGAIVTRRF